MKNQSYLVGLNSIRKMFRGGDSIRTAYVEEEVVLRKVLLQKRGQ